jgi:hypothetical protein
VLIVAVRRSTSTLVAMAFVCVCVLSGCGTIFVSPDVPAGASIVKVVSQAAGEPPTVSLVVSSSSTVRRIASSINRLHSVPSGTYNCPNAGPAGEPTVTLTFRAHKNGAVLAKAVETDFGFGSYPCNPMTISVPGRKDRFLVGGQLLERLERLLGVNFGFGEGNLKGEIYEAGGPATPSRRPIAGQVRLYLTHELPRPGSTSITYERLPQPGPFAFTNLAPGVYLLRASVHGKLSGCPRTRVTVLVGKTTHASIPWGCNVK